MDDLDRPTGLPPVEIAAQQGIIPAARDMQRIARQTPPPPPKATPNGFPRQPVITEEDLARVGEAELRRASRRLKRKLQMEKQNGKR
jgi:hypothetical protein